ncbi:MAG: HAD family phosphatase [Kiritimatiellae bacterium]|nr:HAD family phosphatase [Kiritimatiellia bacterium]
MNAFIFDMDGTLVDNCAWHVIAWREFAHRYGREISEQQALAWMGSTSTFYMEQIFGRKVPPEECAELTREKEALYREYYAPHLRLPDGLDELLDAAREHGIRMAVATGGSMDNVDFILDGLALRDRFDVVVDASQYERCKPAPDCFLVAAARLAVPPSACLVFEDAVAGIRAAKNADMRVAVVTATMPRPVLAAEHPDYLFDSFREVTLDPDGADLIIK